MIDVAVAVEDPLVRIGIKAVLDGARDCRPVALLNDPTRIRSALARHRPDVLILDVTYRRADRELLPTLVEEYPFCRILVLVNHTSRECALRHLLELGGRAHLSDEALQRLDECCLTSMRENAHGCIPQEIDVPALLRAVRSVAAGDIVAAPWLVAAARASAPRTDGGTTTSAITTRELEVIALLAKGLPNKEIGRHLGIREQTVKNHVARVIGKLGVKSRLEVGLLAQRLNLELAGDGSS